MRYKLPNLNKCSITVVGLGYVGLPLAFQFSKKSLNQRLVFGYDIDASRINELNRGYDRTNEISEELLNNRKNLTFTKNISDIEMSDVFIITVPTPVDSANTPNLEPLKNAAMSIGNLLKTRKNKANFNFKSNPIIIFESTVYPGATEEVCVPILEKYSSLKYNEKNIEGFFVGYSPERINPGDKIRQIESIKKVTSGSTIEVAKWVDDLYKTIIRAGTHSAPTIKTAEASKIIENTQRDLNIALINEFSIIFHKLGIDTLDIIEAASTKWNFLNFKPGLVGGHCIGVDPYYLAYKSKQIGYYPHVVLAGRRINDGMGDWVAEQVILELVKTGKPVLGAKVLILGFTFKENCPDIRNTKVSKMIRSLKKYSINPHVHDPIADQEETKLQYDINLLKTINRNEKYEAVIVVIAHDFYKSWSEEEWTCLTTKGGVIFDIKGIVPRSINPIRI